MYDGYLQTLQKRFLSAFDQIEVGYNFDYGTEFEIALCLALRNMLPSNYGICRGFVVASNGQKEGDDILIYQKSSHPSVTARDTDSLLRKEKVPADAVFSYVEAKHTVHLDGKGRQSLEKAVSQVSKVKSIISKRDARQFSQITPDINLNGAQISQPDGYPSIKNPPHGVIVARYVKMSAGSEPMTDDEIYDALDNGKVQIASSYSLPPDIMILGDGIIVLPVHIDSNGGSSYKAPFAPQGHKDFAIGRCPEKAFGVGLSAIAQAIDWMSLNRMPWLKVAVSGIENFNLIADIQSSSSYGEYGLRTAV